MQTKVGVKVDKINDNFQYCRAFLGLAENFEYPKQKVKIKVVPTNKEIERFASPLKFMVFENFIYLFKSIDFCIEKIKGQKFNFEYSNNKILDDSLSVPDIDFNIDGFLDFALKNTRWVKI